MRKVNFVWQNLIEKSNKYLFNKEIKYRERTDGCHFCDNCDSHVRKSNDGHELAPTHQETID